jgi:hypothetical protein
MPKVRISVWGKMEDRKGPTIEVITEVKRGEVWLRHEAKTVLAGEFFDVEIGPRARLQVNDMQTVEEPVYDREQGAAIYPTRQTAPEQKVADKPSGEAPTGTPAREAVTQDFERRAAEAKAAGKEPPVPPPAADMTRPASRPTAAAPATKPPPGPLAASQGAPPADFKPLQPNPNKPPASQPTTSPPPAQPSSANQMQSSKDVKAGG